jgi:hypothetical protein
MNGLHEIETVRSDITHQSIGSSEKISSSIGGSESYKNLNNYYGLLIHLPFRLQ